MIYLVQAGKGTERITSRPAGLIKLRFVEEKIC